MAVKFTALPVSTDPSTDDLVAVYDNKTKKSTSVELGTLVDTGVASNTTVTGLGTSVTNINTTLGSTAITVGDGTITGAISTIDTNVGEKADKATTLEGYGVTDAYTKTETDTKISDAIKALPEPMQFKGTLGEGGTITELPEASSSNSGWTYKVITKGTYAGQEAKVGDTFISDGTTWHLIPSGDDASGTVTNVNVEGGEGIEVTGSPITTSGTITVKNTGVTSVTSGTTDGTISVNGSDVSVTGLQAMAYKESISAADVGLGNVGNFKAVSTVANQTLTDAEKLAARENIGAGTSSFSGSYDDLDNKPVIPTVNNGKLTIQKNGINVAEFTADNSGDVTANISVPTKITDLEDDSNFEKTSDAISTDTIDSWFN